MATAADPCCQEADAFNSEAAACEALACDPTLESCCQRDLEQQALVARLKARLSIHDRSKERLRVAGRVLGTAGQPSRAPPPAAAAAAVQQLDDDLATDEDDEELGERQRRVVRTLSSLQPPHPRAPPLAGRLQARRLQQLQHEAQVKAQLQQQGHGSLTDVPEARLLREAGDWAGPWVCHLALEGSPLGDELDEQLATLAHLYQGTRFTRTLVNPHSSLQLQLRSLPCPGGSGAAAVRPPPHGAVQTLRGAFPRPAALL
jgi:hypothetical protein